MVQKRETKAINKLCVREILSLSFVCGAYFFEFRGRKFVLVSRIISIGGGTCKFAPEAGKARMRTAFFTRVHQSTFEPRTYTQIHTATGVHVFDMLQYFETILP